MTAAKGRRFGPGGASRRGGEQGVRQYPRAARVNQVLREVLAEELERLADRDDRLGLLTVTDVLCEPDFRHATVLFASLGPDAAEALDEARIRLQGAVSRQVRLRRTPLLSFAPDPAVAAGQRVEDLLRAVTPPEPQGGPQRPDAPQTPPS